MFDLKLAEELDAFREFLCNLGREELARRPECEPRIEMNLRLAGGHEISGLLSDGKWAYTITALGAIVIINFYREECEEDFFRRFASFLQGTLFLKGQYIQEDLPNSKQDHQTDFAWTPDASRDIQEQVCADIIHLLQIADVEALVEFSAYIPEPKR